MSNPARDLHAIFSRWRDALGEGTSRSFATAVGIKNRAGVNDVILAFSVVSRLDKTLDEAEHHFGVDLSLFRRDMMTWVQIITGFKATNWTSAVHADSAVPPDALENLERLAFYLDGKVLLLEPSRKDDLSSLLDECDEAVASGDIPSQLAHYINALVREIRAALSDERFGAGFDFGEAVRRLWVCLGAAENDANKPESKKRFATIREKIAPGVATSVISSGAIGLGAIALNALPM